MAIKSFLLCLLAALLGTVANAQDSVPQFDGFIEPLHDIQLAASEIGVIDKLAVQIGDYVQAGQVIAQLDDELQQAAVKIAEAASNMHGAIDAANAEYKLQLDRTKQIRQLNQEGLTRPDELRRVETDLQVAASRWLAAQEEIAMRREELQRAKLQLSRRAIRAPIDGQIAKIYRQAGEYVSPTDPDIVRLISNDALVAVVNVPAQFAARIQPQDQVRVTTTAPPQSFAATILTVSPVIDGQSGTIQLRALLEASDHVCRVGDRCAMWFGRGSNTKQAKNAERPIR